MMSEVSSCIDESHDGKMNHQEVGGWLRLAALDVFVRSGTGCG
jgi:hypothetical protein